MAASTDGSERMTLFSILFVGLLLGIKHATEADHLAAVATLATQSGSWMEGLRQGVAWGLGHTLTLLLFGGVVLALGRSIPPQLEQALEFGVGLMLIGLGLDVLRRLRQQRIHFHAHAHDDGSVHVHAHSHAVAAARPDEVPAYSQMRFVISADSDHRRQTHEHSHTALIPGRALLIGMMHGMAGSAALVALSLSAAPSVITGVLYILVFGAGSILGMALLSTVIALPLRASATALSGLHWGLTAAVGLFSCGLGLWVVYRVGIVGGLLLG